MCQLHYPNRFNFFMLIKCVARFCILALTAFRLYLFVVYVASKFSRGIQSFLADRDVCICTTAKRYVCVYKFLKSPWIEMIYYIMYVHMCIGIWLIYKGVVYIAHKKNFHFICSSCFEICIL